MKPSWTNSSTQVTGGNVTGAKIAASLKYLCNFLGSLELPLFKCKIHLELNHQPSIKPSRFT